MQPSPKSLSGSVSAPAIQDKAAGGLLGLLRWPAVATRYVLFLCVNTLRVLLTMALMAAFFGFLILFGLQLSHPAKWDTWGWVVWLHRLGDPVLAQVDFWLQWPAAKLYYPFALAFLASVLAIMVDSNLRQACTFLGKRKTTRTTPAAS